MKRVIALLFLSLISIVTLAQRTEGNANAHLSGRNVVGSLPKPTYNAQIEGTVVVQIKVDQYGNVTEAVPGVEGTTVTDSGLWNAARNAAMKAHFNTMSDAPVVQTGTIIYKFDVAETHAIKFMGIPIDGPEAQFVTQLKAKGFRYDALYECYKGQFNGKNVDVYLHTNHNVMDRVYVSFPYTSEEGIRVEYNTLLAQFKENGKYADLVLNKEIPKDDDISYEMSINNKRYQASYCFFDPGRNPSSFMDALVDRLSDYFSDDQKEILKRYGRNMANYPADQQEALREQMVLEWMVTDSMQHPDDEQRSERAIQLLSKAMNEMQSLADGSVWFMIHEHYGRYNIGLYYDNLHNQAHGEDL